MIIACKVHAVAIPAMSDGSCKTQIHLKSLYVRVPGMFFVQINVASQSTVSLMSKRTLCLVLLFIVLQAEASISDDEKYAIDNRAGSPLETTETSRADRLHNDVYTRKLSSLRNAKLLPKEPGEMLFSVVHACVQLLHAEPDSRKRRALINAALQESSAMMATYTWDTIADSAERAALAPIDSRRKRRGLSDTSQGNSSYDPAAYLAVTIIKEISTRGKHIPDCAKRCGCICRMHLPQGRVSHSVAVRPASSFEPHHACRNDPSLPGSLPNNTKFMIGANLKNNEGLLPHFTLQLLKVQCLKRRGMATACVCGLQHCNTPGRREHCLLSCVVPRPW